MVQRNLEFRDETDYDFKFKIIEVPSPLPTIPQTYISTLENGERHRYWTIRR